MNSIENQESQIAHSESMSRCNDTKSQKMYSLIPDMITGWKPKNIKIPSPILLKYKSPLVSQLIDYYQDSKNKILYTGPRYNNSLMFHEHISHDYILKFGMTTEDIPKFIQKQLNIQEHTGRKIRYFQGTNPQRIDSNYVFNSHFQSGNLDLVIEKEDNQYNLFLRPDTNTCGHMQWFYFTIKNKSKGKIRLNICNNRKAKTLFERGMKPYVLSKYLKQTKGTTWKQCGDNLSYSRLHLDQQEHQKQIKGVIRRVNNFQSNYCLSFDYTFQFDNDEVSFAYAPPYTFSHLKNVIIDLKKNHNCFETIVTQQKFCTSLSGIDIPLLTITDSNVSDEDKICLVSIGRIHPGESNGSYVIEGFLRYILSEEASQMRKNVVFKVIPMINPDGVIFGNYRTSLSGKDLNRMFRTKNQDLIPEVSQLKSFIKRIKYQEKHKVTYFLDFHGHSLKKNVFFYGPEYDIWSIKYEKAKILPKILQSKTDLFRMKSCLFKVASVKKTTARAFMLAYIPYCYTVESSLGIYRDNHNQDCPFTIKKWNQVGFKIGESFQDIVVKLIQTTNNAQKRKLKKIRKKQNSIIETPKEHIEETCFSDKTRECFTPTTIKRTYLNPIRNMKKRMLMDDSKDIKIIEEEDCQSDGFTQGNSDCQSVDNDLPKVEYDRLRDKIVHIIDSFEIMVVGNKKQTATLEKKDKKLIKITKCRQKSSKKSSQKMLMVPSLRQKNKLGMSEKRISVLNSLQNIDPPSIYNPPSLHKAHRFVKD